MQDRNTYISFGSLGGISNNYTEYKIFRDGTAYIKKRFDSDFILQERLDKKQCIQFFKVLSSLHEDGIELNNPGNLSYFIKWIDKGKDRYEVIWGGGDKEVDRRLQILYKNMQELCIDKQIVR